MFSSPSSKRFTLTRELGLVSVKLLYEHFYNKEDFSWGKNNTA